MTWLLIAIVVVVALADAWWRLRRGAARQRRLMLLCDRAGLAFELSTSTRHGLAAVPDVRRRSTRMENVLWDRDEGYDVRAFDFSYQDEIEERPREPTTPHVHPGATGIGVSGSHRWI